MNLPHSDAAEQALLGMLLADNAHHATLTGLVNPEDFYVPRYGAMFKAIGALLEQGMEANPISVPSRMTAEYSDKAEFMADLVAMVENASRVGNAATMACIIADYANKRRIIHTAQNLAQALMESRDKDVDALQAKLAELHTTQAVIPDDSPLQQAQKAFGLASGPSLMFGTGIASMDSLLGGLMPGCRYMIAGSGGAGKSALAINIAWNVACSGKRVRWLSYEEKPEALWWRIMARVSQTPYISFRNGLTENQKAQVHREAGDVGAADFKAFYCVPTPAQMIAACGPCDLIVLDGMTTAPAPGGESMVDNAGIVTRYCATLAEKTGAAVIILAHINSDAVKNGTTMAGIYGGQAATFDPEGIIEVRKAEQEFTKGPRKVILKAIKARYAEEGATREMMFNGNNMVFYEYNQ